MYSFIPDDSRERYQERLREAEQSRLAKLANPNRTSQFARLRASLGDRLIALGQRLKAPARPTPQFD